MNYTQTIIAPKTKFPMMACFSQREAGMLKAWEEQKLYNALLEKNAGLPPFVLQDSPHFTHGHLTMGNALNRILKDFIVRSHAMMGHFTPYIPGWHTHDLSIEQAMEAFNKMRNRAITISEFRTACAGLAEDYIQKQTETCKRLGILGDWDHPCRTMDKHFEAQEVKIFGQMLQKGYIRRDQKPLAWCPFCATAVAKNDIVYQGTSQTFVRSVPYHNRCKNPIIFRTTPQWFCSTDSFADEIMMAIENVQWRPTWGEDRMTSIIRERADRCISRQRRWGLPIPVFYCSDCGKPVSTPESIAKISALFDEHGSNVWFEKEAMELVPDGFTCPHCGGKVFSKETDTLDCWFDSGSTHFASLMKDTPDPRPADVCLEGTDQYRGWFLASLLTNVGALGQGAPFKQVLTHGCAVDSNGRAMHLSLDKEMEPPDLIKDFGADIIRLWAASSDYRTNIRISMEIITQIAQSYLKFRNTARYCLGNLTDFDPNKDMIATDALSELDKWAVTRLDALVKFCKKAYDRYEFHRVSHAVNDFCVVELSGFYLDILKDRLYCDAANSLSRRSAQSALYLILDAITKVFSPILPFTCDEIWQSMPHLDSDDKRNILLNQMPCDFAAYMLDGDAMAKWDTVMKLRRDINSVLERFRAGKQIGKSLEAHVTLQTDDEELKAACKDKNLPEIFIVSAVDWTTPEAGAEVGTGINFPGLIIGVSKAKGEQCPRCRMHCTTTNADGLCLRCAAVIENIAVES